MHSEAQNLVAACSNCLSLVVRFRTDTRHKIGCAPGIFSNLTNEPYHNTFDEIKEDARSKSRHDEESCANRYRVFQCCDHKIRNLQRLDQARTSLVAAKRAGNAPRCT